MNPDTYLGDGLYASFDGFQIRLYTERLGGTNEVFLEPDVLERFEAFVTSIRNSHRAPVADDSERDYDPDEDRSPDSDHPADDGGF